MNIPAATCAYVVHPRLTPSVFFLKFDLCSVATSSFWNREATGDEPLPIFVDDLPSWFARKPSRAGCLESPSYEPILIATLLTLFAVLTTVGFGATVGGCSPFCERVQPFCVVPVVPFVSFTVPFEGGKYVDGGLGFTFVVELFFSLKDSMLCISTRSSALPFFSLAVLLLTVVDLVTLLLLLLLLLLLFVFERFSSFCKISWGFDVV